MVANVTAADRLRSSMKEHDIPWNILRDHAKRLATRDVVEQIVAFESGGPCSILIAVAIIELIVDRKKGLL